jgi:coenzyme F420 hydrogenase subunit beta
MDGVKMTLNAEGFLRPIGVENLSPQALGALTASCRAIRSDYVAAPNEAVSEGASNDPMWGNYFTCLTGFARDADLRHAASSGGFISAFASWLLETNQVSAVLGTDYDDVNKIRTQSRFVASSEDVKDLAGSKYSPSSPLAIMSELNELEGTCAIIGRPCDISAIRLLMKADPTLSSKVKILISFFCAGTPSDKANERLLQRLQVKSPNDLLDFRHRGNGWPGNAMAKTRDGNVTQCTYGEAWGGILNKDLQLGCKICADGVGEAADVVAADAWYGGENGYPSFNEAEGRSLIIARTSLGAELVHRAMKEGVLSAEPLDIRQVDLMQPGQLKRRRYLANRILAMRLLFQNTPQYRRLALKGYQRGVTIQDKLSAFVGTILRVYKSKRRARG